MDLRQISDPDTELARQAFAIYTDAFPAEERVPVQRIAAMLRDDKFRVVTTRRTKHVWALLDNSAVVGIAFFSYYRGLRLGYLEYLAVRQDARGQGWGTYLFYHVVDQTIRDALRLGGPPALGVCLEVDRPADARTEAERQMRERRIHFYQRNGSVLIDRVEFVAPPLGRDRPPVPYHIMFHPAAPGPVSLADRDLESIVETILLRGYHLRRSSPYFKQAIASLHK